ncbi:hypothetical protein RHGRI_019716 [Rhododendron griersonianum]|uniref:Uncharacterized protein n=1 Tax=Rhododendron griersonianum TaxID=479676 RepID=A0AAV6JHH7_9ERIC|nr:hypothetical protein RHGRI_019716 [Rhododendron griersonianum]KAG5539253.1 hypothetical protein RHGRI_019716 [Rhododendron griersonianum]
MRINCWKIYCGHYFRSWCQQQFSQGRKLWNMGNRLLMEMLLRVKFPAFLVCSYFHLLFSLIKQRVFSCHVYFRQSGECVIILKTGSLHRPGLTLILANSSLTIRVLATRSTCLE